MTIYPITHTQPPLASFEVGVPILYWDNTLRFAISRTQWGYYTALQIECRFNYIQEYVAVSIDICPWQNSMQLGTKLNVTPCMYQGKVAR